VSKCSFDLARTCVSSAPTSRATTTRIEEWQFRGGRIFASVGSADHEADPDLGHGWMSRLVDSGALTAAGFQRVRKATLDLLEP
jgi:hypothetical protein